MSVGTKMIHKPNWPIIAFFSVTTGVALIGGPWYYLRYGLSLSLILLTLFFVVATGMAISSASSTRSWAA